MTKDRKQLPLITVVIPIYNVEDYLKECVDSILKQSYSNLEVLLVDDESPDQCGKICDEYKKKDNRVKVIHQKNKGLSGARNSAIDLATGRYITFVDSDDYIERNMIEKLYEELRSNDAEIAVTALESFFEDGTRISNNHRGKIFIYTKQEALDCFLFNDFLTPCVCGKLYKIELWKNIRCPEKKLFEDQFTTYKLIDICEKIVYVTEPLYNYRKRNNSIGHSLFSKRTYDLYEAIHEEYDFINKKYGDKCPNITVARITWEIVFVNMMIMSPLIDRKVIKDTQLFTQKNLLQVWRSEYISNLRKLQISLYALSYPLYMRFYKVYKKKHPIL